MEFLGENLTVIDFLEESLDSEGLKFKREKE